MTNAALFFLFSLSTWWLWGTAFAQGNDTEVTKLEWAKIRWESLQRQFGPLDYKYGLVDASSQIELSTSYVVLVEQDEVTEVEPFVWSNIEPNPANFLSVNDLFDLVDTNIEIGSSVVATYDDVYGYPSQLTIVNRMTDFFVDYVIEPMTIYTLVQDELDTNMALWNKTSSEDYDYSLLLSCFCVPAATLPKRIQVRGGEIESIYDLKSGLASKNYFYNTLEAQFEEIQDAIEERWYIVSTSYNDTMGYPSSVFFDVHPGLSDDERSSVISDVTILGDPQPEQDMSVSPTTAPSLLGPELSIEYDIDDLSLLTVTASSMASAGPASDFQRRPLGKPMTMPIFVIFVVAFLASVFSNF
jgi:hypothetical protein